MTGRSLKGRNQGQTIPSEGVNQDMDVKDPKPTPGPLRSVKWGVIAVAVLAALVPAALIASDLFADVPNGNPFHNEIGAISRAGITTGCGGGNYCPLDPVTRQAMAAFMHRGFGRVDFSGTPTSVVLTGSNLDIAVITINVPGVLGGGTQFVKVDAAFTAFVTNQTGCPCVATFRIFQDGTSNSSINHQVFPPAGNAGSWFAADSGAATLVVAVPSGTTQTFRLRANRSTPTGAIEGYGQLSAITAPFGSSGTNILSADSQSPVDIGRAP